MGTQPGTYLNIAGWIITGAIAGYVASLLLRAQRQGCLINTVIGVIGALVGGFVMGRFIFPDRGGFFGIGFLDTILNAIVGSVILLIAIELVVPGKQLGVRSEERRSRRRRR
jgi:uncharacterized membrane protein YeaQ/YmgE (transglycosylase-associated protein family)